MTGMVPIADEEGLPSDGYLTSPNWPEYYPNYHDSTQTIQVTEGWTINLAFTDFNTEPEYDYVQIVDGDGTDLTPKMFGAHGSSWEFMADGGVGLYSNSNIVHVKFHTDGDTQRKGWRLQWTDLCGGPRGGDPSLCS